MGMKTKPTLTKIKSGWAARGDGWAVHAPTQEEALKLYEEAERRHEVIMKREDRHGKERRQNDPAA